MTTDRQRTRDVIVDRVRQDLLGPLHEDEILAERPSDRYLTGVLYPPGESVASEEDDSTREEGTQADSEGDTSEVPVYRSMRPSTLGLSFRLKSRQPKLRIRLTGGRYEAVTVPLVADRQAADHAAGVQGSRDVNAEGRATSARERGWRRVSVEARLAIDLDAGFTTYPMAVEPLALTCAVRAVRVDDGLWGVTAVVSNEAAALAEDGAWVEEHALFQSNLEISAGEGTEIVPRPLVSGLGDEEDQSTALLYRDVREWAVGHTAGARWDASGERCEAIATDWLPTSQVFSVSALGAAEFQQWSTSSDGSAESMVRASDDELISALGRLVEGYRAWQARKSAAIHGVPEALRPVAEEHLRRCARAADRMDEGIDLLRRDRLANRAFRFANEAMLLQRKAQTLDDDLRWRPFQLGFQLMCLPSLADRGHADRSVMDLLWFPTGGGKTEAYLALVAFVLFHRRLRADGDARGAGVAAIMRYTLRVLTTQQFQRAAAMICAAEEIRLREGSLGAEPFSVGLWIGSDAIPNKVSEARRDPSSVKVLTACPRCGGRVTNPSAANLNPRCRNGDCLFGDRDIPIHVIDEVIYGVRPSLLIATVDKFAQITREPRTQALFSIDGRHEPPDLVLQDELHLVSGPLGTLAGIFEIAIDEFCREESGPAKVIGSTATIRRAADQVRALFNRSVDLFPPSGIEHGDSGFAITDRTGPGRLYMGTTTAGRSPKFALQGLLSSLLQAPQALAADRTPSAIDPYWTCVAYFNSLRELGGAVVLVEDDVRRSIARLASLRGEAHRQLETPSEITSRVPTNEIPDVLDRLADSYPDSEVDIVLASNMISVGVDIPRLGLMVVNGQPKTTAEYIQATSRVGRGDTPGLVVVLYNAQRPRDRSRYESFATWHDALYRDVEPTSVTPFAPRARDRALHAPLVAMLRHLHPTPGDDPALGNREAHARALAGRILERVRQIDRDAVDDTRLELDALIDEWASRPQISQWWWYRWRAEPSLLIGAEDKATLDAQNRTVDAWATPNSMREVEPSTRFRFAHRLARRGQQ